MIWLSVKDMIPDSFVSVLMYMPNEHPLPMVHEGYMANGHWYYNGNKLEDGYVTHWGPIPEGPNGEYN